MQYGETLLSLKPVGQVQPWTTRNPEPRVVVKPATERLAVGSRFGVLGRYEVLSCLGAGSSSVVYAVRDHSLDRRLAAKFFVRGAASAASAEGEARALARLDHANVVTLYDLGVLNGMPYLLLELLEGVTLAEQLATEQLGSLSALRIVLAVASALEHAHGRGVCHFAVNPGSVHVGADGRVKLLDFGVANHGTLDARTDVRAVGMLLYQCLTAQLPELEHADHTRPHLSLRLRLPRVIDEILERTLAPDSSARFEHVSEALALLKLAERAVLEAQIAHLSPLARQLAAYAGVWNGPLELARLARASGQPIDAAARAVVELMQQNVFTLEAMPSSRGYRIADVRVAQICLERLPNAERQALLHRLLSF